MATWAVPGNSDEIACKSMLLQRLKLFLGRSPTTKCRQCYTQNVPRDNDKGNTTQKLLGFEVLDLLGREGQSTATPSHWTQRSGFHGVWFHRVVVFKSRRCHLLLLSLFVKEFNGKSQCAGLQFSCLIGMKEVLWQRRHSSMLLYSRYLKWRCARENAQDDKKKSVWKSKRCHCGCCFLRNRFRRCW